MNKIIILFIAVFSFSSCKNYDSAKYIEIENEAIEDIILEMTKFEEMKSLSKWNNEKKKLYLISKLDTLTANITEPTGYFIGANGVDFSKEIIENNRKEFEKSLDYFQLEEELFTEFKNGNIKSRDLNYSFENDKLNIELIKKEIVENLNSFETKENEFGYLFMSRIIFNKNFTKGHLHFGFICGVGCAWDNNIEIEKINGTWKIMKYFSGGIA